MPSYNVFFFGAIFFLFGIYLASLGLEVFLVFIFTTIVSIIFSLAGFLKNSKQFFWLAGLVFFIFIGALYFIFDDKNFKRIVIPFEQKIIFEGLIVNNPEWGLTKQEFKVKLQPPYQGTVLVRLSPYPRFKYGDVVRFEGEIKKPQSDNYTFYLAKERINGVVNFPRDFKLINSNQGSLVKGYLFELRNKVISSFQQFLPFKEAALLSGLTLGSRSEFSKEFKEAMAKSGTTHLVALSGYNISIIALTASTLFLYFLPRKFSFVLTVFLIFAFVIMTGAEASVVRAGLMGILALLAKEFGRLYDFRNAVIFAALIMTLINPKVLVFDIGFQLSFLALLGIVYLKPALVKILKWPDEKGIFAWRENFLTTLSSQLAVAPILINSFNNFSLTSFLANILILETVPVAMGLGFVLALVSFVSYYLALVLSWLVWLILRFEILVIEIFSKLPISFNPRLNFILVFFYYLIFIFLIGYAKRVERINRKI